MKKLLLIILISASAIALLSGCSSHTEDTVIWQVSDIHYISPSLIEDRDYFESVMSEADGKVTQYISEITDAFISEALEAKPDAIIISGDLTLSGAKASHEDLSEKLSPLKDAGISVLVIPGNHDIKKSAYRFTSDGVEPVESVTAEEFAQIYHDYGYDDALSRDEGTLSYVSQINDKLRILLVDVNTAAYGTVPRPTLSWIKTQLESAQSDGCRVIAVSHQNLFTHNSLFSFGYLINNSGALSDLYSRYNVNLNLSGHLHIQHICSENGITDIAASSLAVYPHQYGVLDISDSIRYHTERTKVTVDGIDDFAIYSSDFFDMSNSSFADKIPDTFSDEEKAEMSMLARDMNRGLFTGYIASTDDTIMDKWHQIPGFSNQYLENMLPNIGVDYTAAEID